MPALLKRALCESGVAYLCSMCSNNGTWMGAALTLEIDHVDGDFQNNQISNLRFLCPNCHRFTPNFAGRGRGRFTRDLTTTASTSDD